MNTSVGRVSATDADGPAHSAGIVRFSLLPGPGADSFWIDAVTGVLYTDASLDYEQV